MNDLQLRKKLLLAESELNRARMMSQLDFLASKARTWAGSARTFGVAAAAASLLASCVAAFRGGKVERGSAHTPWLQTILKTTGVVSSLWMAFRQHARKPN